MSQSKTLKIFEDVPLVGVYTYYISNGLDRDVRFQISKDDSFKKIGEIFKSVARLLEMMED